MKVMQQKIWTKDFLFICFSNLCMSLNFYVLATAFPLYVKDILHGNEQQMGLAITLYSLGIVLIRPFSGLWVDRYGNKRMVVLGLTIFLIASFCYFGVFGIALFLMIRFFHGMSYAISSTAANTIAISTIPDSRKGEGIGYFSMFMSLAMVVGPALGLFLWKDKNVNLLLIASCVISVLGLLFASMTKVAKRSANVIKSDENAVIPERKKFHWTHIIEVKALPIALLAFILAFSYSSLSGFLASFTNSIHQSQVAGLFFVVFALMIVVFRPFVGKIFDKYKEHYIYYPSIILFGVGLILLGQATSSTMVLVAGLVMGTGYGAIFPVFQTLAIRVSPKHRSGIATATFLLSFDAGYGVGSYVMGMIASITDYRMMYEMAGVVILLSIALYYKLHHRPQLKRPMKETRSTIL